MTALHSGTSAVAARLFDDRRPLLADAFDAASLLAADLVLFERDEPQAPEALRIWAEFHGRSVAERDLGCGMVVLSVLTRDSRHIDVHLVPR